MHCLRKLASSWRKTSVSFSGFSFWATRSSPTFMSAFWENSMEKTCRDSVHLDCEPDYHLAETRHRMVKRNDFRCGPKIQWKCCLLVWSTQTPTNAGNAQDWKLLAWSPRNWDAAKRPLGLTFFLQDSNMVENFCRIGKPFALDIFIDLRAAPNCFVCALFLGEREKLRQQIGNNIQL